jgi:hypothetical protein
LGTYFGTLCRASSACFFEVKGEKIIETFCSPKESSYEKQQQQQQQQQQQLHQW